MKQQIYNYVRLCLVALEEESLTQKWQVKGSLINAFTEYPKFLGNIISYSVFILLRKYLRS